MSDAYDRLYSMVRDGKLSSIELTLVFDGGPTRYQATATLPGGESVSTGAPLEFSQQVAHNKLERLVLERLEDPLEVLRDAWPEKVEWVSAPCAEVFEWRARPTRVGARVCRAGSAAELVRDLRTRGWL